MMTDPQWTWDQKLQDFSGNKFYGWYLATWQHNFLIKNVFISFRGDGENFLLNFLMQIVAQLLQ